MPTNIIDLNNNKRFRKFLMRSIKRHKNINIIDDVINFVDESVSMVFFNQETLRKNPDLVAQIRKDCPNAQVIYVIFDKEPKNLKIALKMDIDGFMFNGSSYEEVNFAIKRGIRHHAKLIHHEEKIQKFDFINAEIDLSANIQSNMLPRKSFTSKNISLYSFNEPAMRVSGDFYDYFWLNNNQLVVLIADVSGKNISASLMACTVKALFRGLAKIYQDPSTCVSMVNKIIIESNNSMMFTTAIFGIINIKEASFEYVNAGHLPIIFSNIYDTKIIGQKSKSLALGVLKNAKFEKNIVHLNNLDNIFMYTDGVTESENSHGEEFGYDRLLEICSDSSKQDTPKDKILRVKKSHKNFVRCGDPFDDVTMLCFQYKAILSYDKNKTEK